MKYAIYNGVLISVEQLRNEINKSGDYKCPGCRLSVIYVHESVTGRTAHFRHLNSTCYLEDERAPGYENKMSEFHFQWQSIFPSECLEHPIGNHRADILINLINQPGEWQAFNQGFFPNFSPRNLVIEIQHSPISDVDLRSRYDTYVNQDNSRELLWIFDLQDCKYEILHIKTCKGEKHYMKIVNGSSSFTKLFNFHLFYKPRIILDAGCNELYFITNNLIRRTGYVEIVLIEKQCFLNFLSYRASLNLRMSPPEIPSIEMEEVDYVKLVGSLPSGLDTAELAKCFHIMEFTDFQHFMKNDTQSSYPGFVSIGGNLGRLSGGDDRVCDIWIRWIQRYRPLFSYIMGFGKYKGQDILDIPKSYRDWLSEKINYDENPGLIRKLELLEFLSDFQTLRSVFDSPENQTV